MEPPSTPPDPSAGNTPRRMYLSARVAAWLGFASRPSPPENPPSGKHSLPDAPPAPRDMMPGESYLRTSTDNSRDPWRFSIMRSSQRQQRLSGILDWLVIIVICICFAWLIIS